MLLTPLIRRQLAVFAVLAVVALSLAAFSYARVHQMAGIGVYDVTVDFEDASGLYPKALVTYRGVKVGQVESLDLADDGAVARLRLDSGVDVPADAVAELHSTSAVGEQYVDLVPADDAGPYLSDGDEIPRERAMEMPQITPVLDKLNGLLASVPPGVTRRVLGQVDAGLGGTGPDLAGLVDSTSELVGEAQRQIGATTSLIATLQPVLGTQADLRGATSSYTASLADLTGELVRSDADVRALLRQGGPGLDAARGVVKDLTPTLPMLLDNLNATGEMLHTYRGSLAQTLAVYPATVARLQSTVNPRARHGDVQLDLRAMFGNPPSCVQGYLPVGQRRVPADTSTRDVDTLAHCDVASTHPSSVRGVRNLPCPNSDARGRLPASCGLDFDEGRSDRAAAAQELAAGAGPSQKGAPTGATTKGADAWTVLVLGPLGLS
jgi:phospholipid/cholesterol/gamma-HCH transport system substrate-binding protein